MKKNSLNKEASKHMDEIWRKHHNPDERAKVLAEIRKKERLNDYAEDLGIDPKQIKNYDYDGG